MYWSFGGTRKNEESAEKKMCVEKRNELSSLCLKMQAYARQVYIAVQTRTIYEEGSVDCIVEDVEIANARLALTKLINKYDSLRDEIITAEKEIEEMKEWSAPIESHKAIHLEIERLITRH